MWRVLEFVIVPNGTLLRPMRWCRLINERSRYGGRSRCRTGARVPPPDGRRGSRRGPPRIRARPAPPLERPPPPRVTSVSLPIGSADEDRSPARSRAAPRARAGRPRAAPRLRGTRRTALRRGHRYRKPATRDRAVRARDGQEVDRGAAQEAGDEAGGRAAVQVQRRSHLLDRRLHAGARRGCPASWPRPGRA